MRTPQELPTATELAHAPEIAILIALETTLAMTTVTIELSLPELALAERGRDPCDPELDVVHHILALVNELKRTIQLYRALALRP